MEYELNNKLGKFYYKNFEFTATVNKNNDCYQLTILDREFESEESYVLINGYINNRPVSLVIINDPIYSSISNYNEEIFIIQFIFLGKRFYEFEELKFNQISLKINNISSTVFLSSFNITNENRNQKHSPLIIKPITGYNIKLNDFSVEIRLNSYTNSIKNMGNGTSINYYEDISVVLHYEKLADINRISKDSIIIKNLFSFITGRSQINEIYSEDNQKKIKLILPIISSEQGKSYPASLTLNETNIEKIFKTWFNNYENLNSIYDLFFSLNPQYLSPATLFVSYTRILESYHRQKFEGIYLSKNKFDKISKEVKTHLKNYPLIQEMDNEEKQKQLLTKIKSSIYYSYEFTFKDRLLELFKDLSEYEFFNIILNKYSNNEDKINDFCDIIKDNRNYYTHYGKKKSNILESVPLSELNESLKIIIYLIMYKEFNLTSNEINEITCNDRRFKFNKYYSFK